MTKPLSVSEARDKLAEVIGQVQYGGERVTISRRGKPVAVVVSVADAAWLEAMEDQIDVKLALEAKAEMEALGGRAYSYAELFVELEGPNARTKAWSTCLSLIQIFR